MAKREAIPPATRATPMNRIISLNPTPPINSFTATIAPFRAFCKTYAAAIEMAMLAVFKPPTKVRKPSSPISPTAFVAMIAACPDPKPGRKAAIKPIPEAAETDFTKFFFESVNGWEICFGMTDFCRRLSMMIERPNNPDNKGNNDQSTFLS